MFHQLDLSPSSRVHKRWNTSTSHIRNPRPVTNTNAMEIKMSCAYCLLICSETTASLNLQEHLHIIEKWLKKWKIEVNEPKSSHITFTLWKGHCPAISISQTIIPQTGAVKYLGLHFDCRLSWKEHIARKVKQIDLKQKRSSG